MSKLLDNLLANTGIKPYMLQRQKHPNYHTGIWEDCFDRQFDTLEEAQEALARLQPAGAYFYRIAQASPQIVYVPVKEVGLL